MLVYPTKTSKNKPTGLYTIGYWVEGDYVTEQVSETEARRLLRAIEYGKDEMKKELRQLLGITR